MNVFLYDKYKKYGGNMLDIIYEDRNMIVVNKPAGQLVQSGRSFELDLTSEVLNYRREKAKKHMLQL